MLEVKEKILKLLILLSICLTLSILIIIIGFIIINGFKYLNLNFILNDYQNGGIFPMIIGTLLMVILSISIGAPIGIISALYLNDYAKANMFTKAIRFAIDALVSIPSIIYGLFGFSFFVGVLDFGYSLIAGALTLAIMILPIIIRTCEESFKSVPHELKAGSLALGATYHQTIFKVILPYSLAGIISAILMAVSRIISESAPLILTAGMVYNIPTSIFDSSRTLTTHLYYLVSEGIGVEAINQAYATALVIIIVIICLNIITKLLAKKYQVGVN